MLKKRMWVRCPSLGNRSRQTQDVQPDDANSMYKVRGMFVKLTSSEVCLVSAAPRVFFVGLSHTRETTASRFPSSGAAATRDKISKQTLSRDWSGTATWKGLEALEH